MATVILYIEDNQLNMRLVRKMLTNIDYNMIEASDGTIGMKMVAESHPDLILMDVNLPDIDGLEVTRRLKAMPHLSHIPIIAVTANSMYGDRERCLKAGCDGYIAKPVTRQELQNVIKHFLSQSDRDRNSVV